jgi:hypothetical protein
MSSEKGENLSIRVINKVYLNVANLKCLMMALRNESDVHDD